MKLNEAFRNSEEYALFSSDIRRYRRRRTYLAPELIGPDDEYTIYVNHMVQFQNDNQSMMKALEKEMGC